MRPMTVDQVEALSGSRVGERLIAHSWYDGELVADDLPIDSWSLSWDADRQVQGQASIEIADDGGTLAPWAVDDPLGVGGARLQLLYQMTDGSRVDIGWMRVTQSETRESWQIYTLPDSTAPAGGRYPRQRHVHVSRGARIPVTADDLTRIAQVDRLLAPESPTAGATVLGEVERLLGDIMAVTWGPDVTDQPVPESVTYERERLDAVDDLLDVIGCRSRMTSDGQLEVYTTARRDPVWTVAGGDDGVLIELERTQALDGLYNAAISEGATDDNVTLIGPAFERVGPLAWDGPHGRYPYFHAATGILKTQHAVDADAATTLATQTAGRSVTLELTCLPHPGLQVGDWTRIECPTVTGETVSLIGVTRASSLRGGGTRVQPMTLAVECSYADVQAVRSVIARA